MDGMGIGKSPSFFPGLSLVFGKVRLVLILSSPMESNPLDHFFVESVSRNLNHHIFLQHEGRAVGCVAVVFGR